MSNGLPSPDQILKGGSSLPSPNDVLGVKKKRSTELPSPPKGKGTTSDIVKTTTQKPSVSSGGKKTDYEIQMFTGFPGKEGKQYALDKSSAIPVWREKSNAGYDKAITDPARVDALNKHFKQKASSSEMEQVFTGFPEKEFNEYRVRDGKWERRSKGTTSWQTVINEGSILGLNKQFKQNVEVTKDIEKAKIDQKREIDNKKNLNKLLSSVNSNLVGSSEEYASEELEKKFPGFKFIQQGLGTDNLLVIAPNKNRVNISLDNFTDSDDRSQSTVLREFIRNNSDEEMAAAERELSFAEREKERFLERSEKEMFENDIPSEFKFVNGKLVIDTYVDKQKKTKQYGAIEDKLKENRKKYIDKKEEQFDDIYYRFKNQPYEPNKMEAAYASVRKDDAEIKRVNDYINDVRNTSKDIASEKTKIEEEMNDLVVKLRSGEITREQYNAEYKPAIEEKLLDLKNRGNQLANEIGNINVVNKAVDESIAKNFIIDESKGSFGGGMASKFVKGLTYIPRIAAAGSMSKKEQNDLVDLITGKGTTQEYTESSDRSDLVKSLFSLSESMGALTAGAALGGGAATYASFYAQSYYEMKDELDEIKGMTDAEKVLMSSVYGSLSSVLEKFGVDMITQKTPIGRNLKNNILTRMFSDLPKGASKEFIDAAMLNSVKMTLANAGLNAVGGAVGEGVTESLQSLSSVGIKQVYDELNDTEYFNNKSGWEILSDVMYEGYLGALGGGVMSTVATSPSVIKNGLLNAVNKEQAELLVNAAKTEGVDQALITNLKASILKGNISKEEAKVIADSFNEIKGKIQSMPDNLSISDKSVALDLMVEKDKIEKEIAGKDENLVAAQKARIADINNQLKTISENATKKSTEQQQEVTAEGGVVQREGVDEGQPEVGKGEGTVGQATEQGTDISNRPVEGRSEEEVKSRISELEGLIASDNASMEKEGQGNLIPEARQSILDELQALKSEPVTPISTEAKSVVTEETIAQVEPTAVEEALKDVDSTTKALDSITDSGMLEIPYTTGVDRGNRQSVSEAYHADKEAGRETELTKAVENLIGKSTEAKAVATEETTVQAEPITVEQPAVEAEVEQLGKLLSGTDQQIEEEAAKISNKRMSKIVSNAARALSKIAPNVKFVIHDSDDSYRKATGEENRSQSSNGEYNPKTKTVHINLTKANARTVAHEVFHAILLDRVSSDAQANAVTKRMIEAIANKIEGNPELKKYLDDFASNYDQNIQNEEKLAELVGKLAENYMNSPQTIKDIIKRWLNKLAGMFSTKPITTEQEVMEVLNTIARKVATGKKIRERQVSGLIGEKADVVANMNKRFQADFKDSFSGLEFVYDKNGDKFLKLEEDGYITKDRSISDFDGQYVFLHQPDAAFSGMIVKRNKRTGEVDFTIEGKGGMYYPIKFHDNGYFWASTNTVAEKMANDLNAAMEKNGGKLLMALTSAPYDKLLSSTTAANSVMDLISSKAFDKNFDITLAQLKTILNNAATTSVEKKTLVTDVDGNAILDKKGNKQYKTKTVGLGTKFKLRKSDSVETVKSNIRQLLNPEVTSFADRKTFVEELIKEAANIIKSNPKAVQQFGTFFSTGIQNKYFKGITKTGKLSISAANMKQAISEMLTEPILKEGINRGKGGQIYAVIELNGKVKAVDSDLHESYPKAIESVDSKNNKVKLHILTDRVKWNEVTEDFDTNEIVSEEREKKIFPTSGVSVKALKINTSGIGLSPRKQLSAPNGKPSNLNEKQWNQVRTPEFKKWFGDWENDPKNASKVVDENGEPMVVFHGSGAIDKFTEFSPTVSRLTSINASYFTDNPDIAKGYSGNLSGNLYEVFLNIREPLTFDFKGNRFSTEISVDMVNTQTGNNYTTEMDGDDIVRAFFKGKLKFSNQTEQTDGIVQNNIMDAFLPSMDSGSNTNFITTRANQIKSATENVGTFSNEERSIRKQLSGLLDRKQNQNASSIVSVARKNGFSEAAIEEYLRRQGFTDQQIQSAMSINDNINVNEIFDRSKKALQEKQSSRSITKAIRFVWNKFIDRQSDIKRLITGIGTKPSQKAFNMLVTRAGAKGWANYRYKEAEGKIYKGLKEKDIDTLDKLIYVRRIISINENRADRGMNPYKGIDGYSEAEARRDLQDMENTLGEKKFKDLSKRADAYFDVFAKSLENLYKSGRITEEVYNNLKDVEYSPIATIKYIIGDNLSLDEIDRQAEIYGITRKDIATLTDKNENEIIMDSQWLLMMNLMSVEARAWENRMLNSFADAVNSATDEQKVALSEYVRVAKSGETVPAGFVTVNYSKDGKDQRLFVKAEYATQLLDVKTRQSGLEALGKLSGTQILRFFATGGNPLFIVGNTAVDFANILFFSNVYGNFKTIGGIKLTLDFVSNFMKKLFATKKYKSTLKEFMEHGGGMDFMSSDGLRALKKLRPTYRVTNTAQKTLVAYGNAMSYLGETSELAFRLSAYSKVKDNLIKEYKKNNDGNEPTGQALEDIMFQAARESRETVDFSQGGSWAKPIDLVMPYFNAALQGFRRPFEFAKKNPVGFAWALTEAAMMSGGMAAMSLASLALAVGGDDEEEKKKKMIDALNSISEHEKAMYHIIFTGKVDEDGEYEYVRIKKLPFLSMVTTLAEQMVYAKLLSTKEKEYSIDSKVVKSTIEKSVPLMPNEIAGRNPLVSALLAYNNYDTFTKKKVFREPRDGKIAPEAEGMFDDKVENFYKTFAPKLGMSPVRTKAFVEKIVTTENTNPTIALFNATLNGIFDKDTSLGEEFKGAMGRVAEAAGKKLVRNTNKDIIMYNEMDKAKSEEILLRTDKYLKEQQTYSDIKKVYEKGEKMTNGELITLIKDRFDQRDVKNYVEKYYTYIQNMDADKSVLDILYEQNAEIQALKIYNKYGRTLDGEDRQEIMESVRTSRKRISPKAMMIYREKYQRGN
jgi:hypothetical protein